MRIDSDRSTKTMTRSWLLSIMRCGRLILIILDWSRRKNDEQWFVVVGGFMMTTTFGKVEMGLNGVDRVLL